MQTDSFGRARSRRVARLRVAIAGLALVVVPITGVGLALAAPGDLGEAPQEGAFTRWLEGGVDGGGLAVADVPFAALEQAAQEAFLAGTPRSQLRAVLFSEAGRNLMAGNAAAGEGRPSPYVPYFGGRPGELAELGSYLIENPSYVGGPGGTQEDLFDRFPGLRESYLASLGLVEIDGRIVDPRNPYLTPHQTSQLLGPPRPLPQPETPPEAG